MAFKIIIISIVYVQCRQHPPNRPFPPPSCLGRSLPLSWQRYATPSIGWIESWLTSRRTFSKRRTKRQRKPSTVCGTTSHTIIKRRHTRSKHASTRRWRKASKRLIHDSFAAIENSPAIQRARDALGKGTRLLADRQKLIKIADRSDNGWGVVAEYTADELAEDSDDEKRLEKAEKTLLLSAADDRTTVTTDAKLA